jgi:hypothetical protein
MQSDFIDQELATCRTLVDALSAVRSLGLQSGSIQLTTPELHGWVVFDQKTILEALIVESGQTGHAAFDRLMQATGAQCRYQPAGENFKKLSAGMTAWEAAAAPTSRESAALARTGFVCDFRDRGISEASLREFLQVGAVGAAAARPQDPKVVVVMANYVMPAVVVGLCVAIYVVPGILWTGSDAGMAAVLRQKQINSTADIVYDGADDTGAQGSAPFQMPQGTTGPIGGVTASGGNMEVGATDQSHAETSVNVSLADPADQEEFALAESRTTLPQLEQLIYNYIGKRKFRRARDLAVAGFKSPVATPEEKQRFWALYLQCQNR